jgi:hypothetical protein
LTHWLREVLDTSWTRLRYLLDTLAVVASGPSPSDTVRNATHRREVDTVLVRLGLVEQRHKAVLEVLGGATVTDVACR